MFKTNFKQVTPLCLTPHQVNLFRWPACYAGKSGGRIQSLHHRMEEMEEESKAKPRDTSFSKETFQPLGYVPSLDHAEKLISSFEAKNTVKFSCYKADKNFENDGKLSYLLNFALGNFYILTGKIWNPPSPTPLQLPYFGYSILLLTLFWSQQPLICIIWYNLCLDMFL